MQAHAGRVALKGPSQTWHTRICRVDIAAAVHMATGAGLQGPRAGRHAGHTRMTDSWIAACKKPPLAFMSAGMHLAWVVPQAALLIMHSVESKEAVMAGAATTAPYWRTNSDRHVLRIYDVSGWHVCKIA